MSLSTHVLDTSRGTPAVNVRVRLYCGAAEVFSGRTDADGRCPALLAPDMLLKAGAYRLVFEIAEYFPNGFYPEVSISFIIRETSVHYHVPLLISPFGFTTYRGS